MCCERIRPSFRLFFYLMLTNYVLPLLQQVCIWHSPPFYVCRERQGNICYGKNSEVFARSLHSEAQAHLLSSGCVTNTFLTRFCTISLSRGSLLSRRGRGFAIALVDLSFRADATRTSPCINAHRNNDRGSPPDVFYDLCTCCLGNAGDTTGNVSAAFLRCHAGVTL